MTPIFADDASLTSLWNLLPLLFTGLMAVGTWGLYWNSRRSHTEVRPQPLEIKVARDEIRVVRDELTAGQELLARKIEEEAEKRSEQISNLMEQRERDMRALHQKMNGILRNLYLIAGKLGVTTVATSDERDD